jgi:hypothetical protein
MGNPRREDFEKYLGMCKRPEERCECGLYHWVSMSNRVDLIIEGEDGSLSKTLQGMNLVYTISG